MAIRSPDLPSKPLERWPCLSGPKANLVADQYIWRWETTIHAGKRKQDIKSHFRQSSLHGHPFSLESLKKREADFFPVLNEDAKIDSFILSKLDGRTSLRQIADAVAATFPSRFNGWLEALSRVGDVTIQYG